jgi:hypothetical protein
LSFLTKVGNMGFGNLVLILPIKHEHAHVVVVKNGGCNTSHRKRAEQTFFTKYSGYLKIFFYISRDEHVKHFVIDVYL